MNKFALNIILAAAFTGCELAAVAQMDLVWTILFAIPAVYFCIKAQVELHKTLTEGQIEK